MVHPIDKMILDRIGRCVHQLVDHGVSVDELHDTNLFRGPEVLPPSTQRILTARQHLVKVLNELRIPTLRIIDNCVMMIRHRACQKHLDLATLCGFDQAISESIVGFDVGTQQELTLGASARDHMELTWKYLARQHSASD
ncbi:MAG TPA: hypothetical protein VFT22_19735 [Kofleriaceae bacterium]|nr:hypothetical protein [Kofleriaceae bacterium]